ncbi:MAG: DUF4097 family beta strand repeat-containing protein [Candidatus Cloacimonetes bacterium]|nr:DUF4097 family beta strand repeat-containing protein [Candidatus Cloacimonadota bacterium]
MKTLQTIAYIIIASLLAVTTLTSCKNSDKYFKDVVDNKVNSNIMVDGIPLQYKGETVLNEPFSGRELSVVESTLNTELQGVSGNEIFLQINYLEFEPGDASFMIEDGKLSFSTKSGNPAAITKITGSIPSSLGLNYEIGTGSLKLSNLDSDQACNLVTGTGSIILRNCTIQNLAAKTGTGSISITDCLIETADLETGTGNIDLLRSQIKDRNFSTGTGKVTEK